MTKWTEFVRAFAKKNGLSYACAMSTPACSQAYKQSKNPKKLVQQRREEEGTRKENYAMKKAQNPMVVDLDEPLPIEYMGPAVRSMDTKRKMPKPRPRIRAKGFMVMSQNEDSNGLTHIYRLSGRHLIGLYRS